MKWVMFRLNIHIFISFYNDNFLCLIFQVRRHLIWIVMPHTALAYYLKLSIHFLRQCYLEFLYEMFAKQLYGFGKKLLRTPPNSLSISWPLKQLYQKFMFGGVLKVVCQENTLEIFVKGSIVKLIFSKFLCF